MKLSLQVVGWLEPTSGSHSAAAQRDLLRNEAGAAGSRSPVLWLGSFAAVRAHTDAATPCPELHRVDAPPFSEPAEIQCTVPVRLPVKVQVVIFCLKLVEPPYSHCLPR